jgi:hypothetical protein
MTGSVTWAGVVAAGATAFDVLGTAATICDLAVRFGKLWKEYRRQQQ